MADPSVSPFLPRVMLGLGLLLLLPLLSTAQSGTVSGRITDAQTGDALPGANIRIERTAIGTAANLDGEYRVTGVPAGSAVFVITYIGYKRESVEVTVPAGGAVRRDVALTLAAVLGEEVVVTAQLEGQARAINQQLASNTIVNVVSSDKIQQLPDQNAAESLGRLPGISVQRDAGEGQKVVVRGLAPRFNAITVNGERIPSTDGDNRSVDLSMISPDLLAGIEVFKAPTPDRDADALGGTVNFVLRKAPEGLRGDYRMQYGYNDHEQAFGQYKATANLSNRFFQNRLGVLVTGNVQRADRSSDLLNADYSFAREQREGEERAVVRIENLNLGDRLETRDRYGGSVGLDYELPNGSLALSSLFSRTDRDEVRRRKRYRLAATYTEYDLRDRYQATSLWTHALSGEHRFGGATVSWRTSYSHSRLDNPDMLTSRFRELAAFDGSILEDTQGPDPIPLAAKNRLGQTTFKDSLIDSSLVREGNLTAQIDLNLPLRFGRNIAGYVKTGTKLRDNHRDRDNTRWWTSSFNIDDLGSDIYLNPELSYRPFDLDIQKRILIGNFYDPQLDIDEFLGGRFDFGPTLDRAELDRFRRYFFDDIYVLDGRVDLEDYEASESIWAGYLMAELNIGRRLMFLPGIRFERTETAYTSVWGRPTGGEDGETGLESKRDTTGGRDYQELLPMVHLRYRATSWFDLRLAVTKTLSRPDYFNLVPVERIEHFEGTVARGNPELLHMHAWNYDAYASFYNKLGLFTAGLFYKRVYDIDYIRETRIQGGDLNGYQLTEPVNAEGRSTVYGGELEIQTNLRFLPAPLDGVVLYLNYSRITSETFFPLFEIGPRSPLPPFRPTIIDTVRAGRMPGQADYLANISVGYEKKGFSGRVSMIFQGPSLQFVGTRSEVDGFTDAFARWDVAAQQKIGRRFSIFLNVNNFTDRPEIAYLGIERFETLQEFFGWTADLGVRIEF